MIGRIYKGRIYHRREAPKVHQFNYPAFFAAFNLNQLKNDKYISRFIGYNKRNILSLYDRDYLNGRAEPLIDGISAYFDSPLVSNVVLVTVPRVFGYVFNPVSFYLGYDTGGRIIAAVAEVNNTFGERHVYALRDPMEHPPGDLRFQSQKTFHVSPFNDRKGNYHFRIKQDEDRLEIHVDLEKDGVVVFRSGLVGLESAPITGKSVLKTLVSFPIQNVLTLPRIHFHAAHLYFRKKMRYFPKPAPNNIMTIKIAKPNIIEKVGIRLFRSLLKRINHGSLLVTMPDGNQETHGSPGVSVTAQIIIKDYTFFRRVLLDGDIGLGEAYMYGQWETPDLTGLVGFLISNRDSFKNGEYSTSRLKWLVNRTGHLLRSNTKRISRKNIEAHYDLSNDFFSLFLDPTMLYSAAVFSSPDDDLEQAQRNKMNALIDKARLEPHHHVLEIGCGWGGLAIEIARSVGCKVTGITISREQYDYAVNRVKKERLEDKVTILLRDYRDVEGEFDRVVSVEMIEAVGHEHFETYFSTIDHVLKQDGLAVLQVITIPHQRYNAYRKSVDWIQKHIFPGGHLPSVEALTMAMSASSKLLIAKAETIGVHYATTLRHWSGRLDSKRDELTRMGFDDVFYRTWKYYFSYCEAAFATRTLDNHHLVLVKSTGQYHSA